MVQVIPAGGLHQEENGMFYNTKKILEEWDMEHMEEIENILQDVLK